MRFFLKNELLKFLEQDFLGGPRIAFGYDANFMLLWNEEDSFACLLHELNGADWRVKLGMT